MLEQEASSRLAPRASGHYNIDARKPPLRAVCCCCGPGNKRYLIAVLCSIGLTIVIGMRAEMMAVMAKLKLDIQPLNMSKNSATLSASASSRKWPKSGTGSKDDDTRFRLFHKPMPWSNTASDLIENSVYIGYLISSPIGGYLTVHHDSSLLLGCSVALTCGLNLFLPLLSEVIVNKTAKITTVILMRLMQGLAEGCLIPAVFGVMRFWGPEAERSSLLCMAVIGVSLGPLIGLPICREIDKHWGWAVVFYIYANVGLIWCIFWWKLIDEKPMKDKNLSNHERRYLEGTITKKVLFANRRISVPWKEIFLSKPIHAIFFTYAADDWTFQISSVCMQSYYSQIFKAPIERTILMLSFPFLARSILVPIGGFLADFIRLKTNLSATNIRKIFAGLGFGLKAVFFIALGFANDEILATILLSMALGFSGLAVAGYAVNVVDLAPNFAGLVMGFASSISTFTGMMSTVIASLIVRNSTKMEWQLALCFAAACQIAAAVVYIIFSSAEEQPWTFEPGSDAINPTTTNFDTSYSGGGCSYETETSKLRHHTVVNSHHLNKLYIEGSHC